MCFIMGFGICAFSCRDDILVEKTVLPEAYIWFIASYFLFDVYALYRIWTTKLLDRFKLKEIDWTSHTSEIYYKIPSMSNGDLNIFKSYNLSNNEEIPSLIRYFTKEPMMVFHHFFGSVYGVFIIPYFRRYFGDCSVNFIFWMEISTPFLHARAILAMMKLKESKLYLWNGLLLVITFFIFRIALLPGTIFMYNQIAEPEISALQTFINVPVLCQITLLIMFSLQLYWFCLIIKVTIKNLQKRAAVIQQDFISSMSKSFNKLSSRNRKNSYRISSVPIWN
jgi:hypothetical protein